MIHGSFDIRKEDMPKIFPYLIEIERSSLDDYDINIAPKDDYNVIVINYIDKRFTLKEDL